MRGTEEWVGTWAGERGRGDEVASSVKQRMTSCTHVYTHAYAHVHAHAHTDVHKDVYARMAAATVQLPYTKLKPAPLLSCLPWRAARPPTPVHAGTWVGITI